MIVADASVVVDMFLGAGSAAGESLARRFADRETVCAPHVLDAEVGQTLRGLALRGEMSVARASASLDDLVKLPIQRFPHTVLISRAFAFRSNVTVYDGIYLALAEALDVPLVSCDTALRNVPGCMATVEILPAGTRTD